MRRYIVVAHQTLGSAELLEAMRDRLAEGPCTFHLLVPVSHAGGHGLHWTEGKARNEAAQHLEEARMRFVEAGLAVTGEVGDVHPLYAVRDVLERDGTEAYDGVIVSTLPLAVSKWLRFDTPTRIHRNTGLPVIHVIAHPAYV
jgi:hypothetical protein